MNTGIEKSEHAEATTVRFGRRDFFRVAGAGTALLLARDLLAAEAKGAGKKPNIVVILADDLGYADLSIQGCKDIPTPNIDSIAKNGVRFTSGYVSCPVCSPTRAGLMTGRYQQRFGHWHNPGPPSDTNAGFGLSLSEITIADLVKKAGYATGMVGKWHLGLAPEFHPMKRGFDEYFGFLHGAHSYVNPKQEAKNPILRGTEEVDEKEYLTDAFTREAVAYIDRHKQEPFFLYLAYNAVHAPLEAPPQKYLDRFPGIEDKKRKTHAAMVSALDDGVGAVLEALSKAGIEEDTMVFFLSDNGGPTPSTTAANTPLNGTKGTFFEGGVRVPFFIQWPARLHKGKKYDKPVISLDILATSVAAAGGSLPADRTMDGVDLVPFVTRKKRGEPHETLFWAMSSGRAVREGKWKLIKKGDTISLFNVSRDTGETKDVAEKYPKVVKRLTDALAQWETSIKPPLWQSGPRPGTKGKAKAKAKPRAKQRPGRKRP